MHHCLSEVYRRHAPYLDRRDDRQTRLATLQTLGRRVEDSGLFGPLASGDVESALTFTKEQYRSLLSTYSLYQGRISPLACQKLPEFSRVSPSIRASSPRTDSSGLIPWGLKPIMRVLTSPGCRIATAMPRGRRSIDSDFPAIDSATFDIR